MSRPVLGAETSMALACVVALGAGLLLFVIV